MSGRTDASQASALSSLLVRLCTNRARIQRFHSIRVSFERKADSPILLKTLVSESSGWSRWSRKVRAQGRRATRPCQRRHVSTSGQLVHLPRGLGRELEHWLPAAFSTTPPIVPPNGLTILPLNDYTPAKTLCFGPKRSCECSALWKLNVKVCALGHCRPQGGNLRVAPPTRREACHWPIWRTLPVLCPISSISPQHSQTDTNISLSSNSMKTRM